MLFLGVLLLFLVATDAFMFPKVCIPPGTTDFPVPCCPLYNGTPCGSGENRGSCMPVSASRSVLPPPDIEIDDRYLFPKHYFSSICQCKGYFGGIDCGGCADNRYGDYCEKQRKLVREDFRQKSKSAQILYLANLEYCKHEIDPDYLILSAGDRFRGESYYFRKASYYDTWCYGHYYITNLFINNSRENPFTDSGHRSSAFLTWHRKYLLYMEIRIQVCIKDPTFRLAYYDWRSDTKCALCNNDILGASDEQGYLHPHSVFSNWRMICADFRYRATYCPMSDCICERPKITRRPGAAVSVSISTIEDVDYCLNLPDYDTHPYSITSRRSARNCIEGFVNRFEAQAISVHNAFHLYCGGTMTQVPISCSDPIFLFHHTFIDKVNEIYIVKWGLTKSSYPDNDIYGHGPYDCIMPFYQCTRNRDMFVTSDTLGYYYSTYKNF